MAGYGLLLALMLVMRFAPRSDLGRWLNHSFVDRPLAALGGLKLHQLIFLAIMAGFVLAGSEMLLIAGPEVVAAYALDLSLYLDAVLVTYAVVTIGAARRGAHWAATSARQVLRQMLPRRRGRARRVRPPGNPSNDDEPGSAWSLAA